MFQSPLRAPLIEGRKTYKSITSDILNPMMKKAGYPAPQAAAIEATASTGGQIMPPVMGAVAFIMAETLGVEYSVIVKAAVIPAMLYFASASFR